MDHRFLLLISKFDSFWNRSPKMIGDQGEVIALGNPLTNETIICDLCNADLTTEDYPQVPVEAVKVDNQLMIANALCWDCVQKYYATKLPIKRCCPICDCFFEVAFVSKEKALELEPCPHCSPRVDEMVFRIPPNKCGFAKEIVLCWKCLGQVAKYGNPSTPQLPKPLVNLEEFHTHFQCVHLL
jgi:hypothetical protein